jgi:hypothetical protein
LRTVCRVLPTAASLVVAAASFALSYVALRDVAAEVEAVPAYLAWLVPIVIDGGVICGSVVIWADSQRSTKRHLLPFFVVGALVVVSVVVNTAHAGPSLLAKGIAALPPLVLLATLELVAAQNRADVRGRDGGAGPFVGTPAAVPVSSPADRAPEEKAPPDRAPAKKTPAKKTAAKRAPVEKPGTRAGSVRPPGHGGNGHGVANGAVVSARNGGVVFGADELERSVSGFRRRVPAVAATPPGD